MANSLSTLLHTMPEWSWDLSITCLFTNLTLNLSFNYFSHESNGEMVPDVSRIDLGWSLRTSEKVKLGVRQTNVTT